MKGRLIGSSSMMVIGLLLAPAANAVEMEIGAVVEERYSGAAGIRITGEQRDLQYQVPIHSEERVITETAESTDLQFLDDSRLYIGAGSVVVLDKFVYDPASQLGEAALRFTKGAFRFVSGQMQNEEAISLRTPKTALVIRGTTVSIFLLADGSEVIASEDGSVGVTACPGGGAESSAELGAGSAAHVNYVCELVLGTLTGPVPDVPSFPGFRGPGGSVTQPGRDDDRGGGPSPGAGSPPSGGDGGQDGGGDGDGSGGF